jgi:hypothetical protein
VEEVAGDQKEGTPALFHHSEGPQHTFSKGAPHDGVPRPCSDVGVGQVSENEILGRHRETYAEPGGPAAGPTVERDVLGPSWDRFTIAARRPAPAPIPRSASQTTSSERPNVPGPGAGDDAVFDGANEAPELGADEAFAERIIDCWIENSSVASSMVI